MRLIASRVGVGAAEVAFPLTLTNLAAWYDASQITGLAGDAAVASWVDLSGGGKHAVQATGGKQPTYKLAIQNGLPVVRFDGTADALIAPSRTWGTTMTSVVVIRGYVAGGNYQVLYEIGDGGAGNHCNMYFSPGTVAPTAGLVLTPGSVSWAATDFAAPRCIVATYDTTQAAADEIRMYVNGSPVGSLGAGGNNVGPIPALPLHLGARGGISLYAAVDFCEVAYYDRVLTGQELSDWWAYADAKWGL